MSGGEYWLAIIAYCWFALVFWGFLGPNAQIHNIVWWPLTLLKFLTRTLWQALTTGWKR